MTTTTKKPGERWSRRWLEPPGVRPAPGIVPVDPRPGPPPVPGLDLSWDDWTLVASALGCAAEVWRNASIVTGAGDETRAAAARVSGESGALGRSVLGALVDVVEGVSR